MVSSEAVRQCKSRGCVSPEAGSPLCEPQESRYQSQPWPPYPLLCAISDRLLFFYHERNRAHPKASLGSPTPNLALSMRHFQATVRNCPKRLQTISNSQYPTPLAPVLVTLHFAAPTASMISRRSLCSLPLGAPPPTPTPCRDKSSPLLCFVLSLHASPQQHAPL